MKIYNTLARQKEEFIPINPGKKIGMYVCGPTVYGPMHLGHARTYISFDFIRRYFEFSGYSVKFISNITDAHDSIIETALKENSSIKEIADKFAKQYFNELEKLKIKKADAHPRVSEFIPQILEFIKLLISKGYAYEIQGSVYFDISKFSGYGKLSRRKLEQAKSGTRIDSDKFEREEAADFALWKKTGGEEEKAGAAWISPWGKGRPGWHIECSAMSKEFLGEQFDLHCGGNDLAFPHHENEIAQSEAASGKSPFVKYWMHSGMLLVSGQKMSKSLGNYITIEDILKKYNPSVLRFFVLSSHYRSPFDYSDEAMERAKEGLNKINRFISRMQDIKFKIQDTLPNGGQARYKIQKNVKVQIKEIKEKIIAALNDDFNTPEAIAQLFKFIKEINILLDENKLLSEDAESILDFLKEINEIFQIMNFEQKEIPDEIQKLLNERRKAREEKNWQKADKIREEIEKLGFAVEDTREEQIVKRK